MRLPLVSTLLLLGIDGAAAASDHGRLVVEAGDFDRTNTPVVFDLPDDFRHINTGGFTLNSAGRSIPLQKLPGGRAVFLLPALEKGETVEYAIRASGARVMNPVTVEEREDGLAARVGEATVLRYLTAPAPPRDDIDPAYHRSGYLHPVMSPAGAIVTDHYPEDHQHQQGVFTAWTRTRYEGRAPDFWNMGKKTARKEHVAIESTFGGGPAGGFVARLTGTDLGATPPKVVIDETWRVTVYGMYDGPVPYHVFDLEWTNVVRGESPLILPKHLYGGLGVRGNGAWRDPEGVVFATSNGDDRASGEGTRPRWTWMGGPVGEDRAGIAVLDHPGNFRFPQPVRLHPEMPYFSVAPPKAGEFTLEPGVPFVSRHRFVVADGDVDPKLLERLWNDFAHPPAARVRLD